MVPENIQVLHIMMMIWSLMLECLNLLHPKAQIWETSEIQNYLLHSMENSTDFDLSLILKVHSSLIQRLLCFAKELCSPTKNGGIRYISEQKPWSGFSISQAWRPLFLAIKRLNMYIIAAMPIIQKKKKLKKSWSKQNRVVTNMIKLTKRPKVLL